MTAAGRWLHLQQPPPHVLIDRIAIELAGELGQRVSEELQRELAAEDLASFTSWLAVRARFTEDMLMRAVRISLLDIIESRFSIETAWHI
jgi:O-methyltransferase involved in polyketide biosynthesis